MPSEKTSERKMVTSMKMPNLEKKVITAPSIGSDAPSVEIAPETTETPVMESASRTLRYRSSAIAPGAELSSSCAWSACLLAM